MREVKLRQIAKVTRKPLTLGLIIVALMSCKSSPILSPPPERAFVSAQMEDFTVCEKSCGCSTGFSASDEVIALEYTLIYRSKTSCDSEGFCETGFIDTRESQCVFLTSTTGNAKVVSASLAGSLGLQTSPEDNSVALLFDAHESGGRTSFAIYDGRNGLQTTRE